MTAVDFQRRAGSVERTRASGVAESLSAVAALARVPVIDDHLHRHLASPNAGAALLLVGSCRQSPVTALAVDRKRRWNTTPRWRRCLFHNLSLANCYFAHDSSGFPRRTTILRCAIWSFSLRRHPGPAVLT